MRRSILTHGNDGITQQKILDYVETLAVNTFIDTHFDNLQRQCNTATELGKAMKRALLIWTVGIAHVLVIYGKDGGLDAWQNNCYTYMPLAHDSQNAVIR